MALHPRSSQDSTHGTVQRVIDLLQCSHVPQSRHQRCIVSAGHSNKDLDSAASDCVSFSKEPRCWQPPTSAALMRCDAVQSQGSGYRRRRGSANSLVLDASRSRVATTAHEDYRFMTRWLTAVGWRRWNDETWRFQWTLLACSRARRRGTVGYEGSRAGNHLQPHALPCLVVRHQHHRDPRYRRSLLRCDDSSAIRSSCVLQVGETSPNFTIHKFPFRPPPTRSARRLQITVLATRRLLWRLSQPPILFLATTIRSLQLQVRNSAMCRTPWTHQLRICCKAMMRRKLYQTGLTTRLH